MKEVIIEQPLNDVLGKLRAYFNAHQIKLFDIIDQQKAAREVSLDIPETKLILFGKPEVGTLLMQQNDWITFDLPSKILLIDKDGKTSFIYREPSEYAGAHQLNAEGQVILQKLSALYDDIIHIFQ